MRTQQQFALILLLSFFILFFLYKTSELDLKQNVLFASTSNFDKAVQLITRIRSNDTSVNGLRYRSLLCTIVRNDPHIAEFLIRHLISGFSHIVVYDNNRIKVGHDLNITEVLAPFVAAGVVTHVPCLQDTTGLLVNSQRNDNNAECISKYGSQADWVALFETDEYFYYEKQNMSVHTLNDLLLKLEQQSYCGIAISWTMMYGEGKMLRQNKTLFDSYPRLCQTVAQQKVLARAPFTEFDFPHILKCNTSNYTSKIWGSDETSKTFLIHYYSKSVEEFLIKTDQSTPPSIRRPIQVYSELGPTCRRENFSYSEDYRRTFTDAYNEFKTLHSVEPVKLQPIPDLNIVYMLDTTFVDYALLMYLKYRVAKRQEFDHEQYLSKNPRAKEAVENNTVVDGLHHFIVNFGKAARGCWKRDNYSICS